jgi:hypothetical protein
MASPPTDPPGFEVGVVTVSYGSEQVLTGFLGSVAGASRRSSYVVVADNLPSPGSEVEKITATARAHYAPMPSNLGYGAAMNAGVALLPTGIAWVLLSNPDVVLSPGAIDELIRVAEADERIASVGPALLTAEGGVYPSARAVPSLREDRRIRPRLLHVLRGRRPRLPVGKGGLPKRVRPLRRRDALRRALDELRVGPNDFRPSRQRPALSEPQILRRAAVAGQGRSYRRAPAAVGPASPSKRRRVVRQLAASWATRTRADTAAPTRFDRR